MLSELRRCRGLDSLELKALSVPSSLRFLLGIEYDVALCVTEVGSRRPFSLHFPVFAETFRKLLSLCAVRFALTCKHNEDGSSVLSGTAVMPLLRYADYLPGALHMEELLECLNVTPATSTKRRPTEPGAGIEFDAAFLDYSEFASDASLNDVHGLGFYLMLDYGLSLASHGHIVDIRFHFDWDPKEALREFQEFSGWETFDLRFYDERDKRDGGVIVFPSIQDACDLLERYEDEDSDDEGDLLPFILRPIAPLIAVPSIEDSVLRKLREQSWSEIVHFWERFPKTKNTVVVYNLFDGATLADVLAFMDTLPVVKSSIVEDASPMRRRRAFLTLADADSARKALELDGRSTKGRTLRVQVAPPYITEARRGVEVKPQRPKPKAARRTNEAQLQQPLATLAAKDGNAPVKEKATATVAVAVDEHHSEAPKPRFVVAAAAVAGGGEAGKPTTASTGAAAPPPTNITTVPSAGIRTLEAAWASMTSTHVKATCGANTSPQTRAAESAKLQIPVPASASGRNSTGVCGDVGSYAHSRDVNPSLMNAAAKEFVPTFKLNVNSPEYLPSAPPAYMDPTSAPFVLGGNEDLLPPPPALPPSYVATLSPQMAFAGAGAAVPPVPRSLTGSSKASHQTPLSYIPPPPYVGAAGGVPPLPFVPPSPDTRFTRPVNSPPGAPTGARHLPPPPPYTGS